MKNFFDLREPVTRIVDVLKVVKHAMEVDREADVGTICVDLYECVSISTPLENQEFLLTGRLGTCRPFSRTYTSWGSKERKEVQ